MNFYKHHLGDYDGATAHLSWDEDMAYTRLLRAYYRTERPIPCDQAYRLARANSRAQRAAVDSVLREFFKERDGGWHNKRADEEIVAYQAQAETNRRIAQGRKGPRTVNEPLHESTNESSTNRTPNHKPDTRSQEPRTKNQKPEDSKPTNVHPVAPGAPPAVGPTKETWSAYATAFEARYQTPAKWNGMTGGMLANFVARLGAEEAPRVAAFYVSHNGRYYVQQMHSVKAMLSDAEKLRTEWATRKTMTETEARQTDRTQANAEAFAPLLAEAREREKRGTH